MKKTEKDFWIEMSIREIWTQAHFAKISYRNIDPKAKAGVDIVFSSIHSFLTHCANISKMLKASNEDFGIEEKPIIIGDILGVSKNSLIHNRIFRNNLEHYDKRLKRWIKEKGVDANIGTYNIGPKGAIAGENFVYVSHYDPTNGVYTFVNVDIKLENLYNEVAKIEELTDEWVKKVERGIIIPPYKNICK